MKLSYFILLLSVSTLVYAQKNLCDRKAKFGATTFCLNHIEGYHECYTYPTVKTLADKTEIPANMVLGFYLNDKIYQQKDSMGLISFDDYFKVYGTKQIQDYKVGKKELGEMQEILNGSFISKNWDSMKKEVDKLSFEIEVGIPTVVKTYKLNKNSFTFIMITKYELEGGQSYIMAYTMNGLLIKDKLIWMAYYLNYSNESTIDRLQINSDKIVNKLLEQTE